MKGVLSNRVRYNIIILSLGDRPINLTRASTGSNLKGLWTTDTYY